MAHNQVNTFGRRLKALRESRGSTRPDLAIRVQLSESYLEKLEGDYSAPPARATIRALAKVLCADADELFCLAGKIPPDIERDLLCEQLLVQVLRAVSQWDNERLSIFLRSNGIAEEKLHFQSTLSRWEIDDERRCIREPITAEIKKAIFARDGFECVYCSAQAILEVDHIYPHSFGGTAEMENLITSCSRCNNKKKDRVAPFPMVFGRFRGEVENDQRACSS